MQDLVQDLARKILAIRFSYCKIASVVASCFGVTKRKFLASYRYIRRHRPSHRLDRSDGIDRYQLASYSYMDDVATGK